MCDGAGGGYMMTRPITDVAILYAVFLSLFRGLQHVSRSLCVTCVVSVCVT
jgi:hypothetical protein